MNSLRFPRALLLGGLSFAAVALSLQACGSDDDPGTAATTDAGRDTRPADTGSGTLTAELQVLDKDKVDVPADLSCMGKPPADAGTSDAGGDAGPSPGSLVDVTFKVVEFGGGGSDVVVNAGVDLFYANTLGAGTPDVSGTTANMDPNRGLVTLKIPFGQRFTYRVNPNDNLRAFIYLDSDPVTKTTGNYELTAITKSKYDQFALAITGKTGFLTAAGTGIYSARVMDCQDRQISNAIVEIVDAATGTPLPTGPGDADLKPVHYLSDNDLPSTGRSWTSRSGLIAAINVPETKTKKLKAIAKGIYGGNPEIRKFAETDLEITASAVNFRSIVAK